MIAFATTTAESSEAIRWTPSDRPRMIHDDPSQLIRHCQWSIRAGRPLIAAAVARMAIEIHLKRIAVDRVKHTKAGAREIAERLRDAGWITIEEFAKADFAYKHLSDCVHAGRCSVSPALLIRQVAYRNRMFRRPAHHFQPTNHS
jgi:hypothetical protein